MALNKTALASELETNIRNSQGLDATPYPELTGFCQAVANTIIDHFVSNAELSGAKANGATAAGDGTYLSPGDVTVSALDINDVPVSGGII